MKTLAATFALVMGAALAVAQTIPNDTEFRVKLLSPISTKTSNKGDKITAQVITPAPFQGSFVEGQVHESKNGNKLKGQATLNFSFDKLRYDNRDIRIQSSIKEMINSQGQPNVDEEGRVIKKKNNLGKAAAITGVGALIGGLAGGAKGAAIGAGAGAAAALVVIEVGVEGANVTFAQGSEFIMTVKELVQQQ